MAQEHELIDYASLVINVTDSLGVDTPPASSSPTAGFSLHRASMGREPVLVKVFSGLPQGCLSPSDSKIISRAFLRELGIWKHTFHSEFFVHIIGRSEYVDCVLASPVYKQVTLAKEFLKEQKNINFLQFISHISKGVETLHRQDVVHGDIRADNILVGDDLLPRIADYSLTTVVCTLDKLGLRGETDVTPATRWLSPEMHQDDDELYKPSQLGDMWSLGMTIYELWSGNMPYHGTPIDKVPGRIRRGQLPSFPGELMPQLETVRQPVEFLCKLCWRKNPLERKTSVQLVDILQELREGKSIASISKEFENRQSPMRGPTLAVPPDGSISSSDTSASSQPEGYDSGHDTVRNQGQSRRTTVETEDSSSVSGWSHTQRPHDDNVNGSGAATSPRLRQAHMNPTPNQGQAQGTHLRPFSAFPPPPEPNLPLGSVTSWMTALLNYKAKHKMDGLKIERRTEGETHLPVHTTTCSINGTVYAQETDTKKKGADERAAQTTLTNLFTENPALASGSSPSYLSTFKNYLTQHELTNRVEWRCDLTGGDAHMLIWTCILLRDGMEFASDTAPRKQDAIEKATKKAATIWTTR